MALKQWILVSFEKNQILIKVVINDAVVHIAGVVALPQTNNNNLNCLVKSLSFFSSALKSLSIFVARSSTMPLKKLAKKN